jgi:hypothetical protein
MLVIPSTSTVALLETTGGVLPFEQAGDTGRKEATEEMPHLVGDRKKFWMLLD